MVRSVRRMCTCRPTRRITTDHMPAMKLGDFANKEQCLPVATDCQLPLKDCVTTGTARKGYENDEIIAPSETTPVRRNLNCVRISILNVRSVTSDSSARLDKTPRDYSTSTEIIKNKCFIHKVRNHKKNIRMFNMCVCHKMSYRCNALLPIYSVKFYLIEGTWT